MPSPRKRRLKRALGKVLQSTSLLTAVQRASIRTAMSASDALVRELVSVHANSPQFGGNSPSPGSFLDGSKRTSSLVSSGLIPAGAGMEALDIKASAILTYTDQPGDADVLRLIDAKGVTRDFIFLTDGTTGDEVLVDAASMDPKRYEVDIGGGDDATYAEFDNALLTTAGLDMEASLVNAGGGGKLHLMQKTAGPAGNTAITEPVAVANIAPPASGGFSGGALAKDALHFYGEDPDGAATRTLTANHGVVWISSPDSLCFAAPFANGGIGSLGNITINPFRADGTTNGDGDDRLHIVAVVDGGANKVELDAAVHDTPVLAAALAGAAADLAAATLNDGAVHQQAVVGTQNLIVSASEEVAAGGSVGAKLVTATAAGMAGKGIAVHWFLATV